MPQLQKPTRVTLSAQIIEQMENCIDQELWPVGTKIPGEAELMETFGVSRNTIREATLSLVYAGILQARPGDGTYVISQNRLDAAIQNRMKDARVRDIMEVRTILEANIVRLAARYSDENDIAELKKALDDRNNPELAQNDFIEMDTEFHLQLARQSHNMLLFDLYNSFIFFIEEEIRIYTEVRENRQVDEHTALYNAIAAHDQEAAEKCIIELLESENAVFNESDQQEA